MRPTKAASARIGNKVVAAGAHVILGQVNRIGLATTLVWLCGNVVPFRQALATSCDPIGDSPIITVDATDLDPTLQVGLRAELTTALGRLGLAACDAGSVVGIAQVRFVREDQLVRVLVDDTLTGKTLMRRFNPNAFPQDARALAMALAASELLTAAWLEINQGHANAEAVAPAPDAVNQIVDQRWQQSVVRKNSAGIGFASEVFSGGETQLGVEVFALHWITNRLALEGGIGFRRGLPRTAPHGAIQMTAAGGFVGLMARLMGKQKALWIAGVTARAGWMIVEGRPAAGAQGQTAHGLTGVARASTGLLLRSGRKLEWRMMLGVGVPLLAVRGLDESTVVAGASGVEWSALLGGSWRF